MITVTAPVYFTFLPTTFITPFSCLSGGHFVPPEKSFSVYI